MSEQNKKNKIDEIKNRLRKAPNGSGYFEDVSYLLQEIERRDKALEWANRIIGSGVDVDAPLRYDPQYWLLQYHEHMKDGEAL